MPVATKYYYWQLMPYHPRYYVFLRFMDRQAPDWRKRRIAIVSRNHSTWYANNGTDLEATGVGKTRDQAVDNLLEQIGGLG